MFRNTVKLVFHGVKYSTDKQGRYHGGEDLLHGKGAIMPHVSTAGRTVIQLGKGHQHQALG